MGEVNCPLGLTRMFDTMTPHSLPGERAHHIPVSWSHASRRPEGLRPPCRQGLLRPPCDRWLLPGEMQGHLLAVGWLKLQHGTRHLKIFKTKATCSCWFAVWSGVTPLPSGAVLQQARGRPEPQGMSRDGPATSSEGQAIPPPWPCSLASQKAPRSPEKS